MGLNRRELLKLGALAGGGLLLPMGLAQRTWGKEIYEGGNFPQDPIADPIDPPPPFQVKLPIPPVLQPTRRDATTDYYTLVQQEANQQIIPGLPPTRIWGYNGIYPGPTIIAQKNRLVSVSQVNRLPDPVSTHLHGQSTLHIYDGYPVDLIQPGQSQIYKYPNLNLATTMWYHDHALHMTSTHLYRGLTGLYILRDEVEAQLPIPKTYGVDDIPLVIADRLFAPDGQLIYEVQGNQGVAGNIFLVNGAPMPRMEVGTKKYRFRVLNGSDLLAHHYRLSTGDPFIMIGTDTALMPRPQTVGSFRISAAERYEFIIDFSKYPVGTQIVLQNIWDDIGDPSPIMRFDVVRQEADTTTIPSVLRPDVERIMEQEFVPANAVRTRKFEWGRQGGLWSINGLNWDTQRADATPTNGDIEIWELYNKAGGWWHPIHIHLIINGFKILDRNGKPPFPYERGLKDTAFVGQNEHVRVIGRWAPYTGRFVFHCHNAYHEDHDMMSQFEVMPSRTFTPPNVPNFP